jgi:hypothetical protein
MNIDLNTSTYSNENLFNIRKDDYDYLLKTGGGPEERKKIAKIKEKINEIINENNKDNKYDSKVLMNILFNKEKKADIDNIEVFENILTNIKNKNYLQDIFKNFEQYIKEYNIHKTSSSKDKKKHKSKDKSKDKKEHKEHKEHKDKKEHKEHKDKKEHK